MNLLPLYPVPRAPKNRTLVAALALLLAAVSAFATTTVEAATTRSYPVKKPPFYRGQEAPLGRIAYLPVRALPGPPGTPEQWVPVASLARLAALLNERLVAMPGLVAWQGETFTAEGSPSVYLGCELDDETFGECAMDSNQLVMAISGPEKRWMTGLADGLARSGADYLLIPAVTITEHWLKMKNLKGSKHVPLGTGYSQAVPWLTSLETPVPVVQLTGVLIDARGKPVRAGVEGMLAVRTPFKASVLHLQRMTSPAEVDSLSEHLRRDDLGGRPWVRDAALEALIGQLVRREQP